MTLPAGNSRTGRASCGPATLTLFASSDGAMLALVDLAVQVPGAWGLGILLARDLVVTALGMD